MSPSHGTLGGQMNLLDMTMTRLRRLHAAIHCSILSSVLVMSSLTIPVDVIHKAEISKSIQINLIVSLSVCLFVCLLETAYLTSKQNRETRCIDVKIY